MRVLFIDSGIGGLSHLSHCKGVVPHASFNYIADTLGFPYGPKSRQEVISTVLRMADRGIRSCDPDIVVVACNTASVLALTTLRENYPDLAFVGVVPAIKPAALASTSRKLALIASQRTVENEYTQQLINLFASGCTVLKRAETELIRLIETDPFLSMTDAFSAELDALAAFLTEEHVDSLVLGCTHFIHIYSEFRKHIGQNVTLYDSREGVSRQVARIASKLEQSGVEIRTENVRSDLFYTTSDSGRDYTRVAAHYGLGWGGIIE